MTYTRNEIMQMPPDELRVAVAKAKEFFHVLNFGDHNCFVILSPYFSNVTMYRSETDAWNAAFENGRFPNWPASIADAYALEDEIPKDKRYAYTVFLNWIINHECDDLLMVDQRWQLIHASSLQRVRAWLMWKQVAEGLK